MQTWEIVVIAVGIVFICLCVYLILFIKKAQTTIERVNKLLDENDANLGEIVLNLKKVTEDTQAVSHRAAKVVKGVEDALGPKVTQTGISESIVKTKDTIGALNLSFLGLKFVKTFMKKLKHS